MMFVMWDIGYKSSVHEVYAMDLDFNFMQDMDGFINFFIFIGRLEWN